MSTHLQPSSPLVLAGLVASVAAQGPTFATTASWPVARYAHAMAYDEGRGRTVLFGGADAGGGLFADTWEWDGGLWIRHLPATSPPARRGHALAYDPLRGVTVLFGGEGTTGAVQDTWEWDGRAWVQVTTPTTPTQRAEHCMAAYVDAATGSSYLLMHGGLVNGGYQTGTWKYDGTDWTFFNSGPMPSARKNAAMARDTYFGTTMMVGGYLGGTTLSDVWYWTGQGWSQLANGPAIHSHAMAFENGSGGGFATRGGLDGTTPLQVAYSGVVASVGNVVWNPYSTQTTWGHVPSLAWLAASAFDTRRQRTVAFGGMTASGPIAELAERPVSGSWQVRMPPGPVEPPRRIYSAMTWYESNNGALLFGGLDQWSSPPATLGDTWIRTDGGWTLGNQTGAPPARRGHAMVTLPQTSALLALWNERVLLHGGYDDATSTRFGDTWAYSHLILGHYWIVANTTTTPRADHAMAYDAARDRVVMFGGYGTAGPLADTIELVPGGPAGATWTPVPTNGSPGVRYSHALAYDPRRQRTVLFGGADQSGTFRGDTWQYDGASATWTQVATTGPEPRVNHEMGYDPARGVVVLFGGRRLAAPQLLKDVWEFDGFAWRERTWTTTNPSAREGAAVTWDPTAQRFLLFGGSQQDTATWAYTADNDRFADGMTGGSTAVRCTQFPVAGRTTGFTFPSPAGFGWLVVEAAPAPASLLFLDPPFTCGSRGHVYGLQPLLADAPGNPARLSFQLPAAMAGAGFTVQGLSLEFAGGGLCFRLTDPLAVSVAAP